MARTTTPLSDTKCRNSKYENKNIKLFDGKGLFLFVNKTSKLWRLKFMFEGKEKLLSLGKYPTVSLSDARSKAEEARKLLSNGINPLEQKKAHKAALSPAEVRTFEDIARAYFEDDDTAMSANHRSKTLMSIESAVFPLIGHLDATTINAGDIGSFILPMKKRGATENARKIFFVVGKIFKYTISIDLLDAKITNKVTQNPCADIVIANVLGAKSKKNHPLITDDVGLKKLLINIDNYKGYFSVVQCLKLLSHVALRSGSIRELRWSWIDYRKKQIVIPSEYMKMGEEFLVPLSKQSIAILRDTQKLNHENDLVFPSPFKKKNQPISSSSLLVALRSMKYTTSDIVPHSFRGIFSTLAHEHSSFDSDVIETQLAHSVGNAVSQAYNRAKHIEKRIQLMQWYSDYLDNIKSE